MNEYKTSNEYYRLWLFWLGIIATVAYRIIIVLNNVSQTSVKVSWYIGTIGFMWYFWHRYKIQKFREGVIKKHDLNKKLCDAQKLNDEDCEALKYVLKTVSSTKAEWNYLVIFVFSAIALIYGIVSDFII